MVIRNILVTFGSSCEKTVGYIMFFRPDVRIEQPGVEAVMKWLGKVMSVRLSA
jgi:hypothetical protein